MLLRFGAILLGEFTGLSGLLALRSLLLRKLHTHNRAKLAHLVKHVLLGREETQVANDQTALALALVQRGDLRHRACVQLFLARFGKVQALESIVRHGIQGHLGVVTFDLSELLLVDHFLLGHLDGVVVLVGHN